MDKIPAPEEMRNATLSPGTKEYLVAYRKAEEAADIVINRVEKVHPNDDTDETTEPLVEKLSDLRSEILRLMMEEIEENLFSLTCTEI